MIVELDMWDAVVIGAGPAGSVLAVRLARAGARVLLVDRAVFPREKVCGCYVNASAAALLSALGLDKALERLNTRPMRQFRLYTRGRASAVPLPGGFAVSRAAFDHALAQAAIEAGAAFRDGVSARVQCGGPGRIVLRRGDDTQTIRAAVVLGCTGLADRSFDDDPALKPRIARCSYMGCATIDSAGPTFYDDGVIHMAHGRGGYVGFNRLEDGRLDVAAALNPAFVQEHGDCGAAINALLRDAGVPQLDSERLHFRGTPLLSRTRRGVASTRLLLVGDAAGYVEPFTGEGIAWAIASAAAAAPIALRAIAGWSGDLAALWNHTYRELLGARQRRCRWLTRVMRPPMVTRIINRALSVAPALAKPFIAAINRSWPAPALPPHSASLAPLATSGARP